MTYHRVLTRPRPQALRPNSFWLLGPAVLLLIVWTQIPFVLTLYHSFRRFNLLNPERQGFVGFENFASLLTDPIFWTAILNTLVLVGSVLLITVAVGLLLAVLFYQDFPGRALARTLVISPFFVMPVVSALIWKTC